MEPFAGRPIPETKAMLQAPPRRVPTALVVALLLLAGGCARGPTPETVPCSAGAPAGEPPAPALFRDVTAASGVDFAYRNGEEAGQMTILEFLGGGLAAFDFDGDGRLDLFITGGGSFAGPDSHQIKGRPCKLYRNVGTPSAAGGGGSAFRFEDVTARVGLDTIDFYTHGVAVGDIDNDGWPDLLVTGWQRLALFHNEPVDPGDPSRGRRFVDVTARAGLPQGLWTTGAAWGDLDGDGYPDLYVCQYVDWSFANHPTDCSLDGKTRDICPPKRFNGLEHRLFRNRGDGTFEDVGRAAGLRVARADADYDRLDWLDTEARERLRRAVADPVAGVGKGLGVLLVDVNGDGRPDVYVTNDTVPNFLYMNRTRRPGKIELEECGLESGTALSALGTPNAGMGVDAADYNGSGRPSLWVTNYAGQEHALYRNECRAGQEFFLHASASAGLATVSRDRVGWGTGFLDVDHHGWEDLVLTAGDSYLHSPEVVRSQAPVLLRNQGGGRFQDVSALAGPYFQAGHVGRGVVLADFDNDGRIDLAVSHLNEPVAVLRNQADTRGRHWLGVALRGAGHRDVVGARVILDAGGRRQTRFAKGGGSYLSSGDRRHVFGLGPADHVDGLRVVWPSGREQRWPGLAVDRYWRLTEGEDQAVPLEQSP
jgi:hypothetical protein